MKQKSTRLKRHAILFPTLLFLSATIYAQCNVNEKYDKIVSGYHQSIALKSDGSFAVWGQAMASDGASDALIPKDITVANFSNLTGTPLKAAIGGQGSGSKEQAVLLTTTGLFAWGAKGNVISTTILNTNTFTKLGNITGSDATTKLPTGVAPADVASLFATYKTLAILTTTGNVWILTQASAALQGNNAASATTTWHQVRKNAGAFLTNVIALRGQVSDGTYSAFMALTSAGEVYTWGSNTFLGDGSSAASRSYATLMTLPAEFTANNIPKMIGVTGGIKNTTTTKNTYYLLSNNGSLYAMGDNTKRQCGDFTTTDHLSWVNVKVNGTTNFNNITFFSCQEHDASMPGVAAITTSGDLYTWGENDGLMLGRAVDGTIYDPGFPGGFTSGTDKAISTELGGHTLVYIKEGSSQFCYVGHKTNGSMGDNDATNTNISSFNCSGTPNISICGYVPVVASIDSSTITVSQSAILANGSSTATITIQLKDASGHNLTVSGGNVMIYSTSGTITNLIDNNNGTYTATLTSPAAIGSTTLSYTINGATASKSASVQFINGSLPLTWLSVQAFRLNKQVKITWTSAFEINVKLFDIERSYNGSNWSVVVSNIAAINQAGSNYYEKIDTSYSNKKLYYRIKEYDFDGHTNYSPVQIVSALNQVDKVIVYPVPAVKNFHLGNIVGSQVKQIQLLNMNGVIIKNWKSVQESYDIQEVAAGTYILRIESNDGNIQNIRLRKQ